MSLESLRIETPRLIVRRFEDRDVADVLDYSRYEAGDEFRRRNIGYELTEEAVRTWWEPAKTMPVDEAKAWLPLLIEVKALGRVIGNTGFRTQKLGSERQGTIGWTLGKAFEGQGYMVEAVAGLIDHLFRVQRFHRLHAMTSIENTRSWGLMERLGMRREAHFIKNCYHDEGWVNEFVYAILAEEWDARRPDWIRSKADAVS